jgi:hypothetical protein
LEGGNFQGLLSIEVGMISIAGMWLGRCPFPRGPHLLTQPFAMDFREYHIR